MGKEISEEEVQFASKFFQKIEAVEQKIDGLLKNPKILLEILKTTDFKIKDDYSTKLSVFFTALSAYTEEPLNLFIKGPSSVGKSYNAVQIIKLFPQKDVWFLGGLSPTALTHLHGELMSEKGEPLGPPPVKINFGNKEEYKKALMEWSEKARNGYTQINLKGKILLFLESPNIDTFNMLRPILSHDTMEISYKFTDKSGRGQLKTMHTKIVGWPATIFLNAKDQFLEELATRSFTVSPYESPEKYAKANKLTNTLNCFPWLKKEYENRTFIIRETIEKIKDKLTKTSVVLPFYGLNNYYPAEIPRDMRDYAHLEQFLKCITALHCFNRPIMEVDKQEYVVANQEDVKIAFLIYSTIFETTRTGVSQHLLDFYYKVIKQREQWESKELVTNYNKIFKPHRSGKTLYKYLKVLADVGYVDIQPSEADKRKNVYVPLRNEEETAKELVSFNLFKEKREILKLNLKKEFENWLKNCSPHFKFYIYNFQNGEKQEIQWDELEKHIIRNQSVGEYFYQFILGSKKEKENENNSFPEKRTKETNSQPIVLRKLPPSSIAERCPQCGKFPVEYEFEFDGQTLRRCRHCIEELRSKGFRFTTLRRIGEGEKQK